MNRGLLDGACIGFFPKQNLEMRQALSNLGLLIDTVTWKSVADNLQEDTAIKHPNMHARGEGRIS